MTNNTQIIDDLHRAVEMEEVMNSALTGLCEQHMISIALPQDSANRIGEILETLQNDTRRHMAIVGKLIRQMEEAK